MSKPVLKLIDNVKPDDLISVDWCDASVDNNFGWLKLSMLPVKS